MKDNVYEISKVFKIVEENLEKYTFSEMRRLLHGRGGTFQDLEFVNIDLFPPAILVTLYEERNDNWKSELSHKLIQLKGIDVIVVQNRVKAPWTDEVVIGELPVNHTVIENGLSYGVSLSRGENSGIFPDMREGRSYVRDICHGKKVLNLFSYTCGFSVAAIEGGAESVLNIDMNGNSLSRGRRNHELNHHDKNSVSYLSHNILKSFGKITKRGPFNLVIIDPPPSQGSSFSLERDYGKILRRTGGFLDTGGEVLACLNSHGHDFQWFHSFLKKNLGDFQIIGQLGPGDDFPEKDKDSALKILHLKRRN